MRKLRSERQEEYRVGDADRGSVGSERRRHHHPWDSWTREGCVIAVGAFFGVIALAYGSWWAWVWFIAEAVRTAQRVGWLP